MKFRIKNKSKKIFIVYSEDKVWGILPEKILHFFSLDIEKEVELSKGKSRELRKQITIYAWDRLLNFLTYRERSIWECKIFLDQLYLDPEISEKLIEKAISNNFVNDERFAELFVESLIAKKKNSTEIKIKLFEKHISGKIINKVLAEKYSAEIEENILTENVIKTLSKYSGFSDKEKIEKCLNYLTRRGFSYYEVKEKINELIMSPL